MVDYDVIGEGEWAAIMPPPLPQRQPDDLDQMLDCILDLVQDGRPVRVNYGDVRQRRWLVLAVARRAHQRGLALERRELPGCLAYRLANGHRP